MKAQRILIAASACLLPIAFGGPRPVALAHGEAAALAELAQKAPHIAVVHVVGDVAPPPGHRRVQLQLIQDLKGQLPQQLTLTAPTTPGLGGLLATARAGSRLLVFLQPTAEGYGPVHRSSSALPLAQQEVVDHVAALIRAEQTDPTGDARRQTLLAGLLSGHPRVGSDAAHALGVDRDLARLDANGRAQLVRALEQSLTATDRRLPGLLLAAGRLKLTASTALVAEAYVADTAPGVSGLARRFLQSCPPAEVALFLEQRCSRHAANTTPGPLPTGALRPQLSEGEVFRTAQLLQDVAHRREARPLLARIAQRDPSRGLSGGSEAAVRIATRSLAAQGLAPSSLQVGAVSDLMSVNRTHPGSASGSGRSIAPIRPTLRFIRPRGN